MGIPNNITDNTASNLRTNSSPQVYKRKTLIGYQQPALHQQRQRRIIQCVRDDFVTSSLLSLQTFHIILFAIIFAQSRDGYFKSQRLVQQFLSGHLIRFCHLIIDCVGRSLSTMAHLHDSPASSALLSHAAPLPHRDSSALE